jgi:hypothetical protein
MFAVDVYAIFGGKDNRQNSKWQIIGGVGVYFKLCS